MYNKSILNLKQLREVINELYEFYRIINRNSDKERFEISLILSKYFKKEVHYIYKNLEKKGEIEYELEIENNRYNIKSYWKIEEDLKDNIKEMVKISKANKGKIFITKIIIEEEINTNEIVSIDFKTIIENLMDLKGVADKIYIDYEDYKNNGMSKWKNGRLLFVNAKKLINMNRKEIEKEYMFSHNIRGYEGEKKSVIKSINKTIEENNSKLMLANNGITIACQKININNHTKKFELTNAVVVNGGQTLRTLKRCEQVLGDDIAIACKIIEYGEEGAEYLDNIAKISNNHITIKNKELNSNLKKYYILNEILKSDVIDKKFRKQLIHKIGQVPKGACITKQEVYMLENAFKHSKYEFEAMKQEVKIISETNAKEIIVLCELKEFLVNQMKSKYSNRYEELKQRYTEKRVNYQIYYLGNLILHKKERINNSEKREKFIEEAYEKLTSGEDMSKIIGEKESTLIISTINLYMKYRLNKNENNDKFRSGLNSYEKEIFFEYMNEVELISNKIK